MPHTHPCKASVKRRALLVNRISFLLISSLLDPTCLISSSIFFYFPSLAPGTNPVLFACTSHLILYSVSPVSSFISNVLPYHHATSQLIISLANPPLLPICLAWIFLAPTPSSSPRFFLLLSIPNTFISVSDEECTQSII